MSIWVDGDACPKVIKEILFRAAIRTKTPVILVANQMLYTPPSPFIKSIQVASGFDVADAHIVARAQLGDLVITADVPLAALVVEKGVLALNPRGEMYTSENIASLLSMRDFMATLRDSGVQTGGPSAFSQRDTQYFAKSLDAWLAKNT
jgi:uncharacterized protein YaiI (UPF0178 family)